MRKNYTDDQVKSAVKNNTCIAGVLRELGLQTRGGNYYTVKRKISLLEIDCSHFNNSNQTWNKDLKLKDWSNYNANSQLKKHLIKHLGHKCQKCLTSVWYDEPVALELHHNDGDRTNNNITNLQLLCPNCHAQTHNWRGKKNSSSQIPTDTLGLLRPLPLASWAMEPKKTKTTKPKIMIEWPTKEKLEEMMSTKSVSTIANDLKVSQSSVRKQIRKHNIDIKSIYISKVRPHKRRIERPPYDILIKEVEDTSYCAVARKYGVSDNAIRKWIKIYEKYGTENSSSQI